MNDINNVVILGRLTSDPEYKTIGGGTSIAEFSIASNSSYVGSDGNQKEEVSYVQCVAFGKLAGIVSKRASKGAQVVVQGSIRQYRWADDQGRNRSTIKIVCSSVQVTTPTRNEY